LLFPSSGSGLAHTGTELPNKRPDILLTTPNGLVKSLNDEMLHWVRHIVIDEADLMLSPVYHDQVHFLPPMR
jgi:superfamily II DNA/RNA helicase